jgi:hypothetical protein
MLKITGEAEERAQQVEREERDGGGEAEQSARLDGGASYAGEKGGVCTTRCMIAT